MDFNLKEHIRQIFAKIKSTPSLGERSTAENDQSESLKRLLDSLQSDCAEAQKTVHAESTEGPVEKLSVDELRGRLVELSKNPVSEKLVSSAMCYSRSFPKYITSRMRCDQCHSKVTFTTTENDYNDKTIESYIDAMRTIGYPVKLLRVCASCAKKQLQTFNDVSDKEISHLQRLIKEAVAHKYQSDYYKQPSTKEMLRMELILQYNVDESDPIKKLNEIDYANALFNYKQCEQMLADYKSQIGTERFHHLLMATLAQQQTLSERNYLFGFPLDGGQYHYAFANDVFYYKTLLTLLQGKSSFEWNEDRTTKEKIVGGQLNIIEYMTGLRTDE